MNDIFGENDKITNTNTVEKDIETVMNTQIEYKDIKSEIDDLRLIIPHLDTCYHIEGDDCVNIITGEIVTDNEYDAFKARLLQIDPCCEIFNEVTAASEEELVGKKIPHNPPMTSISKCNGTQEEKDIILKKWLKEHSFGDLANIVMSFKRDGIALSVEYINGHLNRAGLRSKSGVDGMDVTEKTKYIKNIPQTLPLPLTLTIRGEIETPIDVFRKDAKRLIEEGKTPKSNPRSYTAGKMNRKTAEEMKDAGLCFMPYNVLNLNNPPYETEIERSKWVQDKLKMDFVKTIPFSYKYLLAMEKIHRELNFLVDGAVLSVNNLKDQFNFGTHGNRLSANPRGKLAYKFADEVKEVVVRKIEWQTGRVGSITPVLNFKGVQLEGTIVSKCTAHNWGIIKNNKIGVGTIIEIIKSGKIIPKIKNVIEEKGEVIRPEFCPSCGEKTYDVKGKDGALSLICRNASCPAQNVKNLDHYLKKIGAKGIAESTITKLTESGLVKTPSDFYTLTIKDILNIGIKERTAVLILARIRMIPNPEQEKDNNILKKKIEESKKEKIKISMPLFIAALGMGGAGREAGRLLSEKYKTLEDIMLLTKGQLEILDGIGPITAEVIHSYFNKNAQEIKKLLDFVQIENVKKTGVFENKAFVLSGSFPEKKSHWKKFIEEKGGKIVSSVGRKVNFLVAGEGSGSKTEKANKLNIPIISTEELEEMM